MKNLAFAQISLAKFCSGFGQLHSPNNKLCPKSYTNISREEIWAVVKQPQQVEKDKAQWFIPSTLLSRVAIEQREKGKFWALWADIDEPGSGTIQELYALCDDLFPGCQFMVYTSRSAKEDFQKARIIIFLARLVGGEDFEHLQEIFNDKLQERGITPDRKTETANQICYLPNKGEYYHWEGNENGRLFDVSEWSVELAEKHRTAEAAANAAREAVRLTHLKIQERIESGSCSPIDATKAEFYGRSLIALALGYGFKKVGSRLVSPHSQSGSAAVELNSEGTRLISHHGSDIAAGIGSASADGKSCYYDGFDLIKYFEHSNDQNAALKAMGERYQINGISITKHNQIEYMKRQEAMNASDGFEANFNKNSETLFDLNQFALNGSSAEMEQKMLEDKHILGKVALLGQATAFYAKPNAGKTLLTIWLTIEAIKSGNLNGDDCFYINADDNHKGLTFKLKLAERYGFKMMAPGYPPERPFKAEMLEPILKKLIEQQTARGKVLILDTLKKFTDIMDKRKGTEFMKAAREFVLHGGSLILLAHVNKHADAEGRVVYSGTSDVVDDIDCAYTLEVIQETAFSKTVCFENFKDRGDVAKKAVYRYDSAGSYLDLLESVEEISETEEKQIIKEQRVNDLISDNQELINCILQVIREGVTLKTELVNEVHHRTDESKNRIRGVLKVHTGKNFFEGHRWNMVIGDKNSRIYEALPVANLNRMSEFAKYRVGSENWKT